MHETDGILGVYSTKENAELIQKLYDDPYTEIIEPELDYLIPEVHQGLRLYGVKSVNGAPFEVKWRSAPLYCLRRQGAKPFRWEDNYTHVTDGKERKKFHEVTWELSAYSDEQALKRAQELERERENDEKDRDSSTKAELRQ